MDSMVPEMYRLYSKRGNSTEEGDKVINPQTKVLNDVLAILEVDRVIMKSYNNRIIKFVVEHRKSIE